LRELLSEMSAMKVGGSLRKASITSDMFNKSFKLDIKTKLRLFAEYGFKYIHWCDDWNNEVLYSRENIGQYKRLIESSGLKCIDVHGTETSAVHIASEEENRLDHYVKLLENRIEFCSVVGGDSVVIHPPTDDWGSRPLEWKLDRSLSVFESVKPMCEDLGIALAVENCYPYDEKVLEHYFERYSPEFVGFCFDSGHAHLNKNLDGLMRFSDRLKALHLHDNKGKEDDHQPPFWGSIDWERVMLWIEQSGYEKPINFEVSHHPELFKGTPEEFLDRAVRSVRKAMALVHL